MHSGIMVLLGAFYEHQRGLEGDLEPGLYSGRQESRELELEKKTGQRW